MLQNLSIDIRNSSIQWVLTLAITFWRFGSSLRFQLPKWELTWECGSSFLHTLCTPKSMKCDSWAHSWPAPLQAFALVTSPRLGLRQLSSKQESSFFFFEINILLFTLFSTLNTYFFANFGVFSWTLLHRSCGHKNFVKTMSGDYLCGNLIALLPFR